MRFISRVASDDDVAAYLGTGLLYSLASLARSAADPALRQSARELGRKSFRLWERRLFESPDFADIEWVGEAVRGHGAGASLGLRRPAVREALRAAVTAFDAVALIGFDADRGPPRAPGFGGPRKPSPASDATQSRWRIWCMGLTSAWCGEQGGVPLGARYAQVLRWLPHMRGYEAAWHHDRALFHDVAYAVSHVVYTLNNYGQFLLNPRWLPHEYLFLRAALPEAITMGDADLTGEMLDSLRAFGVPDHDSMVTLGNQYLVDSQNADGSWGCWDADTFYTGFHATWAAIDGLRDYRWTGPRLAFPDLLPQLQSWLRTA